MSEITISKIIDLLDATEISLKPDLDNPHEYLIVQATFFAMHTAKLIREKKKKKVKEAFLVVEYIHAEADRSVDKQFQETYFYCLQAQLNINERVRMLSLMPPEMKERYLNMLNV